MILSVVVLSVSGVSGRPEIHGQINLTFVDGGGDVQNNNDFAVHGNTIKAVINFTESVNATPEVMLEFWLEGEKTLSRSMTNVSNTSTLWTYEYEYNASNDTHADFLKINVGRVFNSTGDDYDPDPKKFNFPVYSYVVNNSSSNANIQGVLDGAAEGNLIFFQEGIYSNVGLNINDPLILLADTGDYRTSGVVFMGESWLIVKSDNVSIKGFRFENVNATQHHGVIQMDKPFNTSNFVFEKNKIFNTSKRGIYQNKNRRPVARSENNYLIADNYFGGIGFNAERIDPNNIFTALFIYGMTNSTVKDNVIDGSTFQGMNFGRYGTSNLRILNNSISNTPRSGIQVFNAMDSNITIEGNVIRRTNNDLTGLFLECHRTEQNRAIRADGGASRDIFNVIEVIGPSSSFIPWDNSWFRLWDRDEAVCFQNWKTLKSNVNGTIVRMLVYNVEAGIMIDGASGITIRDNVITDNHDGIVICPSYCGISNHSYQFNSFDALNENAGAVIENNVIHSNEGRDVTGYNYYSPLGIQSGYNVVYGGGGVIRAVGNYWGSSDDPRSTFSTGDFGRIKYFGNSTNPKNLTSGTNNVFQSDNTREVVQSITMNLRGNVSGALFVVGELSSRPENVGEVSSSREVYRWLEITDNVSDSLVRGADVTFRVSKEWLDDNDINKDDVVLLRYDGGSWDELETDVVSESSDYVVFSAESPGFSFFAVAGTPSVSDDDDDDGGGRSSGRRDPIVKVNSSNEKNESVEKEKEDDVILTKNETDGKKPTPQPVPVTDEGKGNNFWTWFLWILVAIVVLVVVVALLKKKKGKKSG